MDVERRLYYYGIRAGIPFAALNAIAGACDNARFAGDISLRRRVAKQALEGSPWRGFIPKELCYARVQPDQLPGSREMVEAAKAVIEDCRATGWKARPGNPFFQCEKQQYFVDYPALINFALSDAVLQIVSDYYGMVPQLWSFGIWVTDPQSHVYSSQLFHLDKPECSLLKLFINLDQTHADTGPLTFLPANVSDRVRRGTRYEANYFRCYTGADGRLTDEQVFKYASRSDCVVLSGGPGSGGFADTSHCLHFGSRTQGGQRKMVAIAYQLAHKSGRHNDLFDLVPTPKDEIRRLALKRTAIN